MDCWLKYFLFISLGFYHICMAQHHQESLQGTSWPLGVTYEIFVQSFADSNGDGIGDLRGIYEQLDYLDELGIEAIWLMPIHPSPSYHKYDVLDYTSIHPDYGDLDDMKHLVDGAHSKGIKIIIDWVINHSSDRHPWFQKALSDPLSQERDFYVWSKNPEQIAIDPAWHWHDVKKANFLGKTQPSSDEKYYGFFWHEMPDLNLSNKTLTKKIYEAATYWINEIGIDGFRLDAAKFLFGENKSVENIKWWKAFYDYLKKIKPDVYLVGEVWDEPEYIADYFEGIPALFNFRLSWDIQDIIRTGKDSISIPQRFKQVENEYQKKNLPFINATFLSNHDQDRIRSIGGGSINKAKLAASLLLSLPGSPFIYYGEELGMMGKKPDEYIREPFLWSAELTPPQCHWLKPKYSRIEKISPLDRQRSDQKSIFNHYKRLIALRKKHPALAFGEIQTLPWPSLDDNPFIIAFVRTWKHEKLHVFINLSNQQQEIAFDRSKHIIDSNIFFSDKKTSRITNEAIILGAYGTLILN